MAYFNLCDKKWKLELVKAFPQCLIPSCVDCCWMMDDIGCVNEDDCSGAETTAEVRARGVSKYPRSPKSQYTKDRLVAASVDALCDELEETAHV